MKKAAENILFPILLFLLPFWNVNQGLDLADTGYNLTNFANYESLSNTWKLGTYLANEAGRFFMRLLGGDTLLGMNLYASAIIAVLAVGAYFFCKKYIPAGWAFLGEAVTVCLCWCPGVILYNYLTYFFMAALLICLYLGIMKENKYLLIGAGIILGFNIYVRFSNAVQAAFIILVWYGVRLRYEQKKRLAPAFVQTGWCLLGFGVGFLVNFIIVGVRFGFGAYMDMLFGMGEIQSKTSGYSVWDMLTAPLADYGVPLQWAVFWLLYIGAGFVLFRLFRGKWELGKKMVFLCGIPVLYKFAWGHSLLWGNQTMYDLNYYSYNAVYVPAAMTLLFTAGLCLYRMWKKEYSPGQKVLALLVLLVILITPIGSNNKLHPIINNLFLVLPFTLGFGAELFKKWIYPAKAVTAVFLVFFVIQAAGFGAMFVFGDGSYAEKRDTKIENSAILKGIYTTKEKAEAMDMLTAYYETLEQGTPVLSYGNIPGIPYYLGADIAIGSSWPDLASYEESVYRENMETLSKQMRSGEKRTVVITGEAPLEEEKDKKYEMLEQFLKEHGYERQFAVHGISVYY